jgi:myo-inositol-1(or 4)-monophosphatase
MTKDHHRHQVLGEHDRAASLRNAIEVAEKRALSFFHKRETLVLSAKSTTDFVTEADRSVEQCIRQELAKSHPDDPVVGEELGGKATCAYWLVDPIDGTNNFLSGLPLWAISIAFVENGHPILGGISIPSLGRTLIGGKNHPMQEIGKVASTASGHALTFGIGGNEFWPNACRDAIDAVLVENRLTSVCLGSCATSLALAASGELAGYAEGNVGFWDIAAGVALCEAADRAVTFVGKPGPNASFVAVGPRNIQPKISSLTLLNEREKHPEDEPSTSNG